MRRVEQVMGTAISVVVVGHDEDPAWVDDATRAIDDAFAWFVRVDATFSTYKPDSEICRLDRGEITLAACSDDVVDILAKAERFRDETGGYFDVRANPGRALDPSGIVKGWSIEGAAAIFRARGLSDFCISAGGDVRVAGRPEPGRSWQVGIVHPFDRQAFTAVVHGVDIGVATSGTAERGLHVFDPHTGQPPGDLASVTVIGDDIELTDVYATTALAMGRQAPEWLEARSRISGHEAYVIDHGGFMWSTPGWSRYAMRHRN